MYMSTIYIYVARLLLCGGEVERACFFPLVFSASGGMGPTATTVYKKLASMLVDKWDIIL